MEKKKQTTAKAITKQGTMQVIIVEMIFFLMLVLKVSLKEAIPLDGVEIHRIQREGTKFYSFR